MDIPDGIACHEVDLFQVLQRVALLVEFGRPKEIGTIVEQEVGPLDESGFESSNVDEEQSLSFAWTRTEKQSLTTF